MLWDTGEKQYTLQDVIGEKYPNYDSDPAYHTMWLSTNFTNFFNRKDTFDYFNSLKLNEVPDGQKIKEKIDCYTFGYVSEDGNELEPKFYMDDKDGIIETTDGKYYLIQNYSYAEFEKALYGVVEK